MMNKDIQFELTSSNYVNKKYTEFYKKHGYIPKMFNPYNCSEITDIAPTITTQCGAWRVVVLSVLLKKFHKKRICVENNTISSWKWNNIYNI